MKVAIFDSGIGGLTVLNEALKLLPNEDYIFYADSDNVPYGIKSKDEVKKYIFSAVEFLMSKNIKALVVACNTATSVTIKELRQEYSIPILGMEPAVKPAVENHRDKRVLVLGTPITLIEEKYMNLVSQLDENNIVDAVPMPGLVELAEEFVFDDLNINDYLKSELQNFTLNEYGTVVLGCTHFPYFKNQFRNFFKNKTDIIDGNLGTVKHLKNILSENNILSKIGNSEIEFFISGREVENTDRFESYLRYLNK